MEVVWFIVVPVVILALVLVPIMAMNGCFRRSVLFTDGRKHCIIAKTSMGMRLKEGYHEAFYSWEKLASLAEEPYRSIARVKIEESKAVKEYESSWKN